VVRVPGYRSRDPGFGSRRYQIFWEVGCLERGPLSFVRIIEELLGRNSSGSGLENREYGCVDPLVWPRDTLYPLKLAITSPTSGGRSVGIVRLRTKATEVDFYQLRTNCFKLLEGELTLQMDTYCGLCMHLSSYSLQRTHKSHEFPHYLIFSSPQLHIS
jgi:hypothetical protein